MQPPGPNMDITVISSASTETGRKNLEKKRDGGKEQGETLSKPCIWTFGRRFAQRGQSPQEKHPVHGPHWDSKSCRNCNDDDHDDDHDNGSRHCEFSLLVYARLFKCCH